MGYAAAVTIPTSSRRSLLEVAGCRSRWSGIESTSRLRSILTMHAGWVAARCTDAAISLSKPRRDRAGAQVDAGIAVESGQPPGMGVDGDHDHRPGRPFMTRQPGGDHGAVLSGRGSEHRVTLQSECAHRTLKIGGGGGGGGDGSHSLEHRCHWQGRRPFAVASARLNPWREHRGEQIGRRYAAAHLRCRDGTGRGADHHVGRLGHVKASFGQACDDTDRPRISGGATATENQSRVVRSVCGCHGTRLNEIQRSGCGRLGLRPRSLGVPGELVLTITARSSDLITEIAQPGWAGACVG